MKKRTTTYTIYEETIGDLSIRASLIDGKEFNFIEVYSKDVNFQGFAINGDKSCKEFLSLVGIIIKEVQ